MTIEQTDPDPYSIALRRLEKVLRKSRSAYMQEMDDGGFNFSLRLPQGVADFRCKTLPDAINAACDAVEGV
jgi:uncharacterized protein YgfB (UPF0149 family)